MPEQNRVVIAVDPGLTGAFVALHLDTKDIVFLDMPTYRIESKKKGGKGKNELDVQGIKLWCDDQFADATDKHAVVEIQQTMPKEVRGRTQGIVSSGVIMKNYGILIGLFQGMGIPLELVHPRSWKSTVMRDMGTEKSASIVKAKQLVPRVADQLSRVKDHARADALLIGIYAVRHRGVLAESPMF